jgi:hypothetical protein
VKKLLPEIVVSEGFCCEHMWLKQTRRFPSGILSRYLGVSQRAVRYWKAIFKGGTTVCQGTKNCQRLDPPYHRLNDPKVKKRFQLGGTNLDNA